MSFFDLLTNGLALTAPKKLRAFGGSSGSGGGYNGASSGRRMGDWQGSILGPNTLTLESWKKLIQRSRDAIRNYPVATSAIQRFESNMVGTGIRPHFSHPNQEIRADIQAAWEAWVKKADFAGQLSFYGLQSLVARSIFEAGEVFCRYHVIDEPYAYCQLSLIESEQVPVYINMAVAGHDPNTVIREGIVFDKTTEKRTGYYIYRSQPYDSIINPLLASQFTTISGEDMIQVMKPLRPGQLRGVPVMASVLQMLYDLEGYADAERLRKRLGAMFAFFIRKQNIDDTVLPPAANGPVSNNPAIDFTRLEPGTVNELLVGEDIVAPQVPETGDYSQFMTTELRRFAAAVGMTFEQLSGDYTKINYSSARVALLEFRRQAEAFQNHILIDQFCVPVLSRWLKEAVLSGALELPDDYIDDPSQYEACNWISDGFEWVDPYKEAMAAQLKVRSGFMSRSMIIRQNGYDPATIDAQIAEERQREDDLGIITDTNSNQVLIGKETQPGRVTQPDPNEDSDQEADEDEDQ